MYGTIIISYLKTKKVKFIKTILYILVRIQPHFHRFKIKNYKSTKEAMKMHGANGSHSNMHSMFGMEADMTFL